MDIQVELRRLVAAFNQAAIEYALCGGLAVAFHGYSRFTKDLDILIARDSLEHALRVAAEVGFLDSSGRIQFCAVSAEGLVAMKRSAGRDQDLLDIKMLGFELLSHRNMSVNPRKTKVDMSSQAIANEAIDNF